MDDENIREWKRNQLIVDIPGWEEHDGECDALAQQLGADGIFLMIKKDSVTYLRSTHKLDVKWLDRMTKFAIPKFVEEYYPREETADGTIQEVP